MRALLIVVLALGCATAEDDPGAPPGSFDASTDGRADTRVDPPDTGIDTGVDTGACPTGQTLCGAQCVTTDTDLEHCGACGNACPEVVRATRTCVAGKCGFTCTADWGKCGSDTGCDTNLATTPEHCGACGTACPTSATTNATCAAKVCGSTCKAGYASVKASCTNFGGAFETDTGSCSTCHNGNAYSSSGCTCPEGMLPSPAYALQNDACGAIRPATLSFCESYGPPVGVWGGAYQADDPVACSVACRVVNPKTAGCSCPSGFTSVSLRALAASTCGTTLGTNLVACVHPTAALDTFAGLYQEDDAVPGGTGCRRANPRTGACSCPVGYWAYPLRSIVDSARGAIGSRIFWCGR